MSSASHVGNLGDDATCKVLCQRQMAAQLHRLHGGRWRRVQLFVRPPAQQQLDRFLGGQQAALQLSRAVEARAFAS